MLSQLAGCIVGVISVVLIAKLMGASDEIISVSYTHLGQAHAGVYTLTVLDGSNGTTVAYLYAVPYELYEKYGVRRYGFHGTSHRYV